jgi:hypothetical protein
MAFKRYWRRKWFLGKPKLSFPTINSHFLDADIRATLNSYQYLKKILFERLEKQAQSMTFVDIIFKIK